MFDEASYLLPERPPTIVPTEAVMDVEIAPSRPWNFWDVLFIALGLTVTIIVLGSAYDRLVDWFIDDENNPGLEWVVLVTSLTFTFFTGYVVTVLISRLRGRTWSDMGYRTPSLSWMIAAVGLGIIFLPIRIIVILFVALIFDPSLLFDDSASGDPAFESFDFSLLGIAAAFIVVVFLAPLAEELVFRGVLYGWLRKRVGIVLGVGISGFLFGLAHIEPLIIVSNSILGFVLALSYEYSKSLWIPMIIHFVNNLIVAGLVGLALLILLAAPQ